MSRLSKLSVIFAGTLALAAASASAQQTAPQPPAQPQEQTAQPQPRNQSRQGRMARPARVAGLNLTAEQREQMGKLREESRIPLRTDRLKLQDARRALRLELFAASPDQGKIAALKNDITQLVQQVEARQLELQERMAGILTPEQRLLARDRRAMRGPGRHPRANRAPRSRRF